MNLSRERFHRLLHDLIQRVVGIVNLFKRTYALAGIWWVIFAASMIVLAVSFIFLALLLYLYL